MHWNTMRYKALNFVKTTLKADYRHKKTPSRWGRVSLLMWYCEYLFFFAFGQPLKAPLSTTVFFGIMTLLREEQLRKVSHRICVTDSGITILSREVQAANALCLIRVARLVIMPTPSMILGNAMTLCAITYSSQGFISFVFFVFILLQVLCRIFHIFLQVL